MTDNLHVARLDVCGHEFTLAHSDPDDHIFRTIQSSHSFYESPFLHYVSHFLSPGDRVIDVGANIGNHVVFFAGVCKCDAIASLTCTSLQWASH